MDSFLNPIRAGVKKVMHKIAVALDNLSGGRLTPNTVTIVGLLAHLPIAWLIASSYKLYDYSVLAGIFLIVFGLFDALDGELARLQKRASPAGMFLDSITDRMKEIIIYVGILAAQASLFQIEYREFDTVLLCLTLLVLSGSLLTSYINAWGEAVLARAGASKDLMNKTFRGGLASFEIRMAILALGLLTGTLIVAVLFVGVLVVVTITERLTKVFQELNRIEPSK